MKQTRLDVRDVDARAARRLGVAADRVRAARSSVRISRNVSATTRATTNGTTHGTPWMMIGAFERWRSWLSRNTAMITTTPSAITFAAHTDIAAPAAPRSFA